MKKVIFLVCEHCKNIVQMIDDKKVPVQCCGQKMVELVPNVVEASGEKHLPVPVVEEGVVKVSVGSVEHPMVPEHLIEWVYLEMENGGQIKYLRAEEAPEVKFFIGDEKPVAVYAYCNLHGLWMAEL